MNLEILQTIMDNLSKKRPIFHNEADFQHELAWEIREYYTNVQPLGEGYPTIRLEKRRVIKMNIEEKEINVDIIIGLDKNTSYFLEIKYCTDRIKNKMIKGEFFNLKEQSASDIRCYDFFKDISRLEHLIREEGKGYAIFLTNETNYWKNSGRKTKYDNFRVFDKRSNVKGKLIWRDNDSPDKSGGRDSAITLLGDYHFKWNDYGKLVQNDNGDNVENDHFKYLIVEIYREK